MAGHQGRDFDPDHYTRVTLQRIAESEEPPAVRSLLRDQGLSNPEADEVLGLLVQNGLVVGSIVNGPDLRDIALTPKAEELLKGSLVPKVRLSDVTWLRLRSLGAAEAMRASYFAVALIPVFFVEIKVLEDFQIQYQPGWRLGLAYVAALLLAFGKFTFDLRCPFPVSLYESLDAYRAQINLAHHESIPGIVSQARVDAADARWNAALTERRRSQWVCAFFFGCGGLATAGLVGWRTWDVAANLFG